MLCLVALDVDGRLVDGLLLLSLASLELLEGLELGLVGLDVDGDGALEALVGLGLTGLPGLEGGLVATGLGVGRDRGLGEDERRMRNRGRR